VGGQSIFAILGFGFGVRLHKVEVEVEVEEVNLARWSGLLLSRVGFQRTARGPASRRA
jgi:hypothetical protein